MKEDTEDSDESVNYYKKAQYVREITTNKKKRKKYVLKKHARGNGLIKIDTVF